MLFALFVTASSSWAYECILVDQDGVCATTKPDCFTWPSNGATYRISTDDFSGDEADEIEAAAEAWNADGLGGVNPGVDFEFVQGADLVGSDGTWDDGTNNVRMKEDGWFNWRNFPSGFAAQVAIFVDDAACDDIDEFDMTFRSSVSWSTGLESDNLPADTYSIGQLAVHEFGHALGLGHQSDTLASMDPTVPHGGDLGGTRYRINEPDFVGQRAQYPDASNAGTNFMLSVFRRLPFQVNEAWSDSNGIDSLTTWEACPGETLAVGGFTPAYGPTPIFGVVHHESGQGPISAKVEWRLDPGEVCFWGPGEIVIGSRNPGLKANVVYEISPSAGYHIPIGTPLGEYHLCARVDSDFSTIETSEIDNTIRSDKVFEVVACLP